MSDTKVDPMVDAAIEAFRNVERKGFALERAERDLTVAVARMAVECDSEQRAEFYRLTEEIRAEYEAKRAKENL